MRTLLLGAMIGGLLAAIPVDLYGDALGGVNRSLDSADRTLENVDRTTERSKNVFDRIKGWFKQNRGNTPADPLVREVQQGLASLGFNPGPADGVVGPQTLDAILRFQQTRGLPQDARVTREFAELLRGLTLPTPVAGSAHQPALSARSEADILVALQYSSGADVHHYRCAGDRSPRFREEFLNALSQDNMMRFAASYDDEFVRQYDSITACQPRIAEWMADMHRQKLAVLGPVVAAASAPTIIAPAGAPATMTNSVDAAIPAATGVGPPLSNPNAALSSNLALSANLDAPPATATIDPVVVGAWAWIHPRQGIMAFVNVNTDGSYKMESRDAGENGGRVEADGGVFRLMADGGGVEEFIYDLVNPDEINLTGGGGEKTVLLRNKIQ